MKNIMLKIFICLICIISIGGEVKVFAMNTDKQTVLSIKGDKFFINDALTYNEIPNCKYKGLLMNARFIQGVFDDKIDKGRFQRFNRIFDEEKNTQDLIKSLPEWYDAGLRAITVGFQGGGPCLTIDSDTIDNNPFGKDGKQIDPQYLKRMGEIIDGANRQGMVVIVSLFYGAQTRFLVDDMAVEQATISACKWLKSRNDKNVIIEIANEHDTGKYEIHPILHEDQGIVKLIKIAQEESGGMPVGCSGTGGYFSKEIAEASDVILIHGNEQSRQHLYQLIQKAKDIKPIKPIVVNEDSQALSQLSVTFQNGVSWGYYNNMTKQEPPVEWGITRGEDQFYAMNLREYLKGEIVKTNIKDEFYLQGLESGMEYEGKRFIRLAALHPEKINYVEFYRNGSLYCVTYDDPYCVNYIQNWLQGPVKNVSVGEEWKAIVHLRDGQCIEKKAIAK